jgi:hypothetical protein
LAAGCLGWQQWIAARSLQRTALAWWPLFLLVPLAISMAVGTVERRASRLVPVRSLAAGAIAALLGGASIGLATLLAGETGAGNLTPVRFALGAGLAQGALGSMEAVVVVGIFLAQRSDRMPGEEVREMAKVPDERQQAA